MVLYFVEKKENIKVIDLHRKKCFDSFSDIRNCISTFPINMLTSDLFTIYCKNSNLQEKILYY